MRVFLPIFEISFKIINKFLNVKIWTCDNVSLFINKKLYKKLKSGNYRKKNTCDA